MLKYPLWRRIGDDGVVTLGPLPDGWTGEMSRATFVVLAKGEFE